MAHRSRPTYPVGRRLRPVSGSCRGRSGALASRGWRAVRGAPQRGGKWGHVASLCRAKRYTLVPNPGKRGVPVRLRGQPGDQSDFFKFLATGYSWKGPCLNLDAESLHVDGEDLRWGNAARAAAGV